MVRDSFRRRALRPRDKKFSKRCYSPGSSETVPRVAVVEVPELWGEHQELGQPVGALVPHLARAVPELRGGHLTPLSVCRDRNWGFVRVGEL